MGIIDTLSAGFSAVNRRLWVIAIPVFLDLFLWLGPKLTAEGLVQRFFDFYADLAARSSTEMVASGQAETAAQLVQLGEQLRGLNFFGFLAWQTPSLIYAQMAESPAGLFTVPVLSVDRGSVLVGLIMGLGLLSLLLQSAYLGAVSQAIKGDRSDLESLVRRVALNWWRLIAFFALVMAAVMVLGMPIVGVTTIIAMISPVLSSLVAGLMFAFAMWAGLYLFFAVAAMFVSDVGPLRASWYSFNIVRRYFWAAMALIVLVLMIRFGVARVWGLALGNPAGVMTAILGNAYIDAGLAAASMIFYRDRLTKWHDEVESKIVLANKA